MRIKRVLACAALLAIVASGCASKSVGFTPSPVGPTAPNPTPKGGGATPTPAPTTAPTTVSLHVTIPNRLQKAVADEVRRRINARKGMALGRGRRHPRYVSPSSAGVSVLVTQGATTIGTFTYDVSATSPLCTGSGASRTCSLTFPLAAGTYSLAMGFYDAKPVGNAIPGTANLLSEATISKTIVANTNNVLTFDLEGVIAGLSGNTFTSVASGTPATTAIAVVALDADGNPIVADALHPYENPISVSLTVGNGHANIIKNGTNVGNTATLTYSTDSIAIAYDGLGIAGYGITTTIASAGVTSQVAQISPLYVTGNLNFTDAGQTKTLTASEVNAPASVSYTGNNWTCAGGFTKAGSGSGASYTFSVTSPPATSGSILKPTYSCGSVTISDGSGVSAAPVAPSVAIPVAQVCASSNTNVYIGTISGGNYQTSNGSDCALSVPDALAGVTIYAAPNNAAHPGSVVVGATEANDATTPGMAGCGAGPQPTLTNGMAVDGSLNGSLSGGITVAQNYATGTCTLTVKDNNGQTQPVLVTIAPAVAIPSGTTYSKNSLGCVEDGPVGDQTPDCAGWLVVTVGPFTSETNAGVISYTWSNAGDTSGTTMQGVCTGLNDLTNGNYYDVPGLGGTGSQTTNIKLPASIASDKFNVQFIFYVNENATWEGNPITWTFGATFVQGAPGSATTPVTLGTAPSPGTLSTCEPIAS